MVVGVIAVFTLVNVRVVTHARVMVSVNQEILFNRRCFREAEHVEIFHNARTAVQKYTYLFGTLCPVVELVAQSLRGRLLDILLAPFVAFQVTLGEYLFLAFIQISPQLSLVVLERAVTWARRVLALLYLQRIELIVLLRSAHLRALLLAQVDVV